MTLKTLIVTVSIDFQIFRRNSFYLIEKNNWVLLNEGLSRKQVNDNYFLQFTWEINFNYFEFGSLPVIKNKVNSNVLF